MKKLNLLQVALVSLFIALAFSFTSCNDDDDDDDEPSDDSIYALVNIPFAQFYAAETTNGDFDAYTSATQKAANGSISYGTYHKEATESDAKTAGITYPVRISKAALVSLGGTEITDETAAVDITITGRGASTIRYSGKQLLFQSADYSYYVLNETPAYYKQATVKDGVATFGKIVGTEKELGKLYVTIAAGEQNHDFSPAITLYQASDTANGVITVTKLTFADGDTAKEVKTGEDSSETLADKTLSALKTVIATDTDGNAYGLTTLSNLFWGKSQMGFKAPASDDEAKNYYPQHALVGKTIAKLTFITESGIYTATDITVGSVTTADGVSTFTAETGDKSKFTIPNLQAAAKQK